MELIVRRATAADSEMLTRISFAAKRHWNYPDSYFETWKDELTITPDYIAEHTVLVAEQGGDPVGYASLVAQDGENCLDHLYVLPICIGKGIGSRLLAEMKTFCREQAIRQLTIFSDPHAQGFYDKLGARYIEDIPSNIPGRNVAMYELAIE